MADAVRNGEQRSYYVVAYAQHDGEDRKDVIAQGVLDVPENTKANAGSTIEGNIDFTANYKCDGHASTAAAPGQPACHALHANAVERVRARLLEGDGNVGVYWRRFHPMVTDGTVYARPGQPFEHKGAHGTTLRVEVREILPGQEDKVEDGAISQIALRRMQADLQPEIASTPHRMRIRNSVAQFEDVELAAAYEQIDEMAAKLKDIPNQAFVEQAKDASKKAAAALFAGLERTARDAMAEKVVNKNSIATVDAAIAAARKNMAQVFAPLTAVQVAMKKVVELQERARQPLAVIDAAQAAAEAQRAQFPTLDITGLDLPALRTKAEAIIAEARKEDAIERTGPIDESIAAFLRDVEGLDGKLDVLVARERAVQVEFQTKVDWVQLWRTDAPAAAQTVYSFIEAGGMFPGFAYPYFNKRADEVCRSVSAQLADLGGLAYHRREDQKKLEAELKKLGPVTDFLNELRREMYRLDQKLGGQHAMIEVRGEKFEAPHAWTCVLGVNADGTLNVRIRVQNHADRALGIELDGGPRKKQQLVLAGLGRTATVEMKLRPEELTISVFGVGPAGVVPKAGEPVLLKSVDVPSTPLELVAAEGATRHALPYMFTPAGEQPAEKNVRPAVEAGDFEYHTALIPGLDPARANQEGARP